MSGATISADDVVRWIQVFASRIVEHKDYLTQLDSAIGDADHGTNMNRGMSAAVEKLDGAAGDDVGGVLKTVGMTLVSKVGGAGGPLYGTLFLQMGAATAGKSKLSVGDWAKAVDAGLKGVQARGKAEPGDKTMIDALTPAAEALAKATADDASLGDALSSAAQAAEEGMKATIPLVARKGRASYLGERSAGHQDPGATSSFLLMKTAAETFGDAGRPGTDRKNKSGRPGTDRKNKSGRPGTDRKNKSGRPGTDRKNKSGRPGTDRKNKSQD